MAAKWLLKSDPEHYSYFDLERDGKTVWDGIANNLALKNLRNVRRGDQVVVYHTGDERAAVGLAEAASDPYPDPKQKDPRLVVIDHNNEETVGEVLDRGFWAAFSIYPSTKMGNVRMVEILRRYGARQVIVDSACDWGISEPLAVAKTAKLALQTGISADQVRLACYQNALDAYGQSGQMKEADWLNPQPIDQRVLFEGNSILRGGREPVVEMPKNRHSMIVAGSYLHFLTTGVLKARLIHHLPVTETPAILYMA